MTDKEAPAAFAALEKIESGDWDRYLLRLRAAINQRLPKVKYRAKEFYHEVPTSPTS